MSSVSHALHGQHEVAGAADAELGLLVHDPNLDAADFLYLVEGDALELEVDGSLESLAELLARVGRNVVNGIQIHVSDQVEHLVNGLKSVINILQKLDYFDHEFCQVDHFFAFFKRIGI